MNDIYEKLDRNLYLKRFIDDPKEELDSILAETPLTADQLNIPDIVNNSTFTTQVINNTTITGASGAQTATFVVGPSSNSDSAGYDYVTDGVNDQVQVQQAVDALPANGGTVLLREGTYRFDAANGEDGVSVIFDNAIVRGMGYGTIIRAMDGAGITPSSLFSISGNAALVDMQIDGNDSGGASCLALVVVSGDNVVISGCFFSDEVAISTGTVVINGDYVSIEHCFFSTITAGIVANSGNSISISNCFFSPTNVGTGCIDGGNLFVSVTSCQFVLPDLYAGVAIFGVETATGNTILVNGNVNGCDLFSSCYTVDSNYVDCGGTFTADTGSYVVSAATNVSNNYIRGGKLSAFISSGSVISNNYLLGSAAHGIIVANDNTIVSGNRIISVGQATTDTYYSIAISTNADHCVINGNVCTNIAANKPKYVINEGSGCDSNIITSNVATGGVTGQINIVGGATVSANNITA